MKKILFVAALMMVASCAQRVKVMNANSVSMTKTSLDKKQKVVDLDHAEGKFCPDTFNDKGNLGLMDEAIKDLQKKTGADFISSVSFYREGNCMVVTGIPQKIK